MNIKIINNWNSVVNKNDDVYIIGDYVWRIQKSVDLLTELTNKLNGNKYLIRGNHDRYSNYQYLSAGIKNVFDIYNGMFCFNQKDLYFTLCHYSLKFWDRSHYGSYCLYGHQHYKRQIDFQGFKKLQMSTRTMNVCMDGNNLYPYSIQTIMKEIQNNPINFVQR